MNASAAHRRDAKPKVNFVDSFFESDDGAENLEQGKTTLRIARTELY